MEITRNGGTYHLFRSWGNSKISANHFEGLIFLLACCVHFVGQYFGAISSELCRTTPRNATKQQYPKQEEPICVILSPLCPSSEVFVKPIPVP